MWIKKGVRCSRSCIILWCQDAAISLEKAATVPVSVQAAASP